MFFKEVVDLSWKLTKDIKVYPGGEPLTIRKAGDTSKGDSSELSAMDGFCLHYGTHLDCPAHMVTGGFHCEDKPASYFIGNGKVIDCSAYGAGTKIGMEVLEGVNLENIDFLLFYTNWEKNFGTEQHYVDYPVLSLELAQFLGSHPTLKGFGIETNNCDVTGDESYQNHKALLGCNNKILFEALKNLKPLLGKDFILVAPPILVEGAEGGPCRAIALVL